MRPCFLPYQNEIKSILRAEMGSKLVVIIGLLIRMPDCLNPPGMIGLVSVSQKSRRPL